MIKEVTENSLFAYTGQLSTGKKRPYEDARLKISNKAKFIGRWVFMSGRMAIVIRYS
jgi:hypothetical protein